MKIIRKNILLVLILALVLMGCTGGKNEKNKEGLSEDKKVEPIVSEDGPEEQEDVFPITINNYDGSLLEINEKPMRIASLILGTDEMLIELVEENRIVGLSGNDADNEAISNISKEAMKFPKMENNLEVILEAEPDLVIGSSWVKKELLAQLTDSGIPYYGYKTPNTIEEQKQIILELSKILGNEDKGLEILSDIDDRISKVEELSSKLKEEDKIRVMPYTMHGSTNAKGTIVDEAFNIAGLINAATEAGLEDRAEISKEQLIEINPEAIIVLAWAKDDLREFEAFVEDLKNDKSLENVKAIKDGKVYMASSRYMTTVSHHIVDGIEYIQETIYPNLK